MSLDGKQKQFRLAGDFHLVVNSSNTGISLDANRDRVKFNVDLPFHSSSHLKQTSKSNL